MIAAIVLIVDCISKGLIWYAMGSSISPPKKNKNLPFDEQATLGFPTSYSYTDDKLTIESSSYSKSDSYLRSQHSPINKHHKYIKNHMDNYSSYDDNSIPLPKRKYYGVEEAFADEIKKPQKYYRDFSYKNDSIIDVIDSDISGVIGNNKRQHSSDYMMNKYKRVDNSSFNDNNNSESSELDYIDSSHSRSVYTEINKDITESISKSSHHSNLVPHHPPHYLHHHHKISPGKKDGFERTIMVRNNNKPTLYSKNVKIHREGFALPAIKMEKSPSFIPPDTYGNIYDFNEISSDIVNINRRNPNYYYNQESNHHHSPNTYISIKSNQHHPNLHNKMDDKGIIKNNNNNKSYHRKKRYEESDISKEISKIQKKKEKEEEIIYMLC